jgi:site-specific DNA-methyltransferase (adenine-specific)
MNITDKITITNEDNMELMARYPDNYFNLAVVDPEYGIGASKPSRKPNKCKQKNGKILNVKSKEYKHKEWDNKPAGVDYFNELFRVSKNQIIWGVNYYEYDLRGGRIVWDKLNGETDQFDCEIAYNSLNNRTDIVRFKWSGMIQGLHASRLVDVANHQNGNKKKNETRIHPTQKPVALYEWILNKYAKPNDKIIDTHLGSGSIAIACNNLGFELTACELDKDYFNDTVKRLNNKFGNEYTFDDAPSNQTNIFGV